MLYEVITRPAEELPRVVRALALTEDPGDQVVAHDRALVVALETDSDRRGEVALREAICRKREYLGQMDLNARFV